MSTLRRGSKPVFQDITINRTRTGCLDAAAERASVRRGCIGSTGPDSLLTKVSTHLSGLMVAALVGSMPSFLDAAEICMPAAELDAALIEWYGETVFGPGPNGTVLWVSDAGQTWTLVKYSDDGQACSVDHGTEMPGNVLLIAME